MSADRAPDTALADRVPVLPVLQRQLVFVTGKGGVGKTTVAAALAVAASASGRETTLCQVGARTRLAELCTERWPAAAALAPGRLSVVAIDPDSALREWMAQTAGRAAAAMLSRSDVFGYLVAAAPGARELVTIGKAWDLAARQDPSAEPRVVILDGPATGHAIGLLQAPATYAEIVRVGPVGHQASAVRDFLGDPARTAIVLVATPAEMPVSETIELADAVARTTGRPPDLVVLNQVLPDRFTRAEIARIRRTLGSSPDPGMRGAAAVAEQAQRRAAEQHAEIRRLRTALPEPLLSLPFLFVPTLGALEVAALADRLRSGIDAQ